MIICSISWNYGLSDSRNMNGLIGLTECRWVYLIETYYEISAVLKKVILHERYLFIDPFFYQMWYK